MKKVSAKMFFTVVWKGFCQALGWFFGLFGYKRDGRFAKCVWGLFATSSTVIVTILAFAIGSLAFDSVRDWYMRNFYDNLDPFSYENEFISHEIFYHNKNSRKGFIYNSRTKEKLLENVEWIAMPYGDDSLVCFSNGKKRGYFNKFTGKMVIGPKYNHAWIFSNGLASVEEDGYIKFIDGTGKVVIDKRIAYNPDHEGYVFHNDYCIIATKDHRQYGLLDREGNYVLPVEYDEIELNNKYDLWIVQKSEEFAVFDKEINPILPFMQCSVYIAGGTIDVTMPDHTVRKYDLHGNMLYDFYISDVRKLVYEKNEINYKTLSHDNQGTEFATPVKPKAFARLWAYEAGDNMEGLMTADGHIVTMPLYNFIEALDHDLYLCSSTNFDKVIVNGKGEIVK